MNKSSQPSENEILTIPEVANFLKISKSKIYGLVAKREIPHLKIGRNVRIRLVGLEEWIKKQTT